MTTAGLMLWTGLAIPAPWLLAGSIGGALHFASLRWNATLYISAGRVWSACTLQALRMAGTAALLLFAALHGATPLLSAAIGFALARLAVVHPRMALR